MSNNVAIFVDGDNLGKSNAAKILRIGKSFGEVVLARVYGNQQTMASWSGAPAFQFVFSGNGKNASDLQITVDAMEFFLTKQVDVVILGTSDNDFVHLARKLREYGKTVVGCGHQKAKRVFGSTCSEFKLLSEPKTGASQKDDSTDDLSLDDQIKEVIAKNSKHGKGMKLSNLNPTMRQDHNVKISELPEKTWRKYLSSRPKLYDLDPKGPNAMVRFRSEGFQS